MVLNDLSRAPTPFDSESVFTLTSLVHVDPTATLPIVVGLLTFANIESSEMFMTDSQRQRKATADARHLEKRKGGFELGRLFKPALRIASIIRVLVATMVPGVGCLLFDRFIYSHAFLRVLCYTGLPLLRLVCCKLGLLITGD